MSTASADLPDPVQPFAHYLRTRIHNGLLYVSGQLPVEGGELRHRGRVGEGLSIEEGTWCAEQAALNCLAAVKAEIGDLARVKAVVKVTVFVSSAREFYEQHLVANGASDVFLSHLGSTVGAHARSAVAVPQLPMNAPVEVEATFAVAAP